MVKQRDGRLSAFKYWGCNFFFSCLSLSSWQNVANHSIHVRYLWQYVSGNVHSFAVKGDAGEWRRCSLMGNSPATTPHLLNQNFCMHIRQPSGLTFYRKPCIWVIIGPFDCNFVRNRTRNNVVLLNHSFFTGDSGGQERFRSLVPSYIRDSAVCVIVYDISSKEAPPLKKGTLFQTPPQTQIMIRQSELSEYG